MLPAPVPDSGTLVMVMDGRASLHGVAQKSWVSLLISISVFCVRQKNHTKLTDEFMELFLYPHVENVFFC